MLFSYKPVRLRLLSDKGRVMMVGWQSAKRFASSNMFVRYMFIGDRASLNTVRLAELSSWK